MFPGFDEVDMSKMSEKQKKRLEETVATLPPGVDLNSDPQTLGNAISEVMREQDPARDYAEKVKGKLVTEDLLREEAEEMAASESHQKAFALWSGGLKVFATRTASTNEHDLDKALSRMAQAYVLDEKGCNIVPGIYP